MEKKECTFCLKQIRKVKHFNEWDGREYHFSCLKRHDKQTYNCLKRTLKRLLKLGYT